MFMTTLLHDPPVCTLPVNASRDATSRCVALHNGLSMTIMFQRALLHTMFLFDFFAQITLQIQVASGIILRLHDTFVIPLACKLIEAEAVARTTGRPIRSGFKRLSRNGAGVAHR